MRHYFCEYSISLKNLEFKLLQTIEIQKFILALTFILLISTISLILTKATIKLKNVEKDYVFGVITIMK